MSISVIHDLFVGIVWQSVQHSKFQFPRQRQFSEKYPIFIMTMNSI